MHTCIGQRPLLHQNTGSQLYRTGNFSLQPVIFNTMVKRQRRHQTSIALLGNLLVPTPGLCFPSQVSPLFPGGKGELFGAQAPFFGFILHYSRCSHWWKHGLEVEVWVQTHSDARRTQPQMPCLPSLRGTKCAKSEVPAMGNYPHTAPTLRGWV